MKKRHEGLTSGI